MSPGRDTHRDGLYSRLGLSPEASPAEIGRAYRRLAHASHPDTNPEDPQASRRFLDVTEAYEVLSDTDRRARYDRDHAQAARSEDQIGHPPPRREPNRAGGQDRRPGGGLGAPMPMADGPGFAWIVAGPVHQQGGSDWMGAGPLGPQAGYDWVGAGPLGPQAGSDWLGAGPLGPQAGSDWLVAGPVRWQPDCHPLHGSWPAQPADPAAELDRVFDILRSPGWWWG
jgi:hypothetical protein